MCFPLHASACMHASVCGLSSRTERARDCPLWIVSLPLTRSSLFRVDLVTSANEMPAFRAAKVCREQHALHTNHISHQNRSANRHAASVEALY